ncbi:Uncharacterised protein [Gallibacterium anatis]|uniref:Lipoprotein n=1 Tax=Gallibacterium anatis TaxID=750 RepID=A0A377H4A5_9PAST|nr:hypothetical protein [Gallibacterium anatis]KGQ59299.1 hypothetical protein IE01_00120 [Gallibacterium anatis DSM 16844 = F 149]STO37436.1 Uncharacterised protein [Gallibacterium anatis]
MKKLIISGLVILPILTACEDNKSTLPSSCVDMLKTMGKIDYLSLNKGYFYQSLYDFSRKNREAGLAFKEIADNKLLIEDDFNLNVQESINKYKKYYEAKYEEKKKNLGPKNAELLFEQYSQNCVTLKQFFQEIQTEMEEDEKNPIKFN